MFFFCLIRFSVSCGSVICVFFCSVVLGIVQFIACVIVLFISCSFVFISSMDKLRLDGIMMLLKSLFSCDLKCDQLTLQKFHACRGTCLVIRDRMLISS